MNPPQAGRAGSATFWFLVRRLALLEGHPQELQRTSVLANRRTRIPWSGSFVELGDADRAPPQQILDDPKRKIAFLDVNRLGRQRAAKRSDVTGAYDKSLVLGNLERASDRKPKRVRATVISDRKKATLAPEVAAAVDVGSIIYSDEFGYSLTLDGRYVHAMVNHAEEYVKGNCHTNSLENFWSLLKRTVGGTYVAVEPFHLFRYIEEQAFRFNNRKDADGEILTDAERFGRLCSQILGKRLTYQQLTGKESDVPPQPKPKLTGVSRS